jgi:hypothetical protein
MRVHRELEKQTCRLALPHWEMVNYAARCPEVERASRLLSPRRLMMHRQNSKEGRKDKTKKGQRDDRPENSRKHRLREVKSMTALGTQRRLC